MHTNIAHTSPAQPLHWGGFPKSHCTKRATSATWAAWSVLGVMSIMGTTSAWAQDKLWLGLGASQGAAYLGSAKTTTALVPLWDFERALPATHSSLLFARVSRGYAEAGVQTKIGTWDAGKLFAGIQAGYEAGRTTKNLSAKLQAMGAAEYGDAIGLGFHLDAQGKVGPAPMGAVLRFRQRTPAERGMLVDLRYDVGVYANGALGVGLNAQAIWANAQAQNSDFGVSVAQAAAVGASAFTAKSGWQSMALGAIAKYDFSPSVQGFLALNTKRLDASLANSPVVEMQSSKTVTTGLLWKF